jgi:hypothetical protein
MTKDEALIKPRMDTDKHGLRRGKRLVQQNRNASLIGAARLPGGKPFPIRAHLCPSVVENCSTAWIRLSHSDLEISLFCNAAQ